MSFNLTNTQLDFTLLEPWRISVAWRGGQCPDCQLRRLLWASHTQGQPKLNSKLPSRKQNICLRMSTNFKEAQRIEAEVLVCRVSPCVKHFT